MMFLLTSFLFVSCDEDEVPVIGFTAASSTVTEGDALSIPLTVALPNGVTPTITLTGTATEDVDYTWGVSTDGKELVFEVLEDNVFDDETIIIEITGFSGDASLGETIIHTVTIQDPSLLIELTWDEQDAGSADIDLFLLKETTPGSGNYTEIASSTSVSSLERVVLSAFDPNARYAVTMEYYEGSSNDVDITLSMSTTAGTINGTAKELNFTGTLTQYHLGIDVDVSNVIFTKTAFNYSSFTPLFIETPPADMNITLQWTPGPGSVDLVDMDLYLWRFNTTNQTYEEVDASLSISAPTEMVTVPADAPNGTYGVSYYYYGGTSNSVQLTSTFNTPGGSILGTTNKTVSFNALFTLANKNASLTTISQTFVKTGSVYSNFSAISTAVSALRDVDSFSKTNVENARRSVLPKVKSSALRTFSMNK